MRPIRAIRAIPTISAIPALVAVAVLVLPAAPAAASIFIPSIGFEDDVDVVVAPNLEFIVVPEENEDGSDAQLRIIKLNPATGEPVPPLLLDIDVPGFENGVDPIIITQEGAGFTFQILVPVEEEDGSDARVIQILTDAFGNFIARPPDIMLGDLGFREDVDGIWGDYNESIAFFVLESEDHLVRGVVAIDANNDDGDCCSCRLLSTNGQAGCAENELVAEADLPGLADCVDPLAYGLDDRLRLAVPVSSAAGSDLRFVDFDSDLAPGNIPPVFLPPIVSVKATNAGGELPVDFPGYERDVDLVLLGPGQCVESFAILVPVEGPGDVADLYSVDGVFGTAVWILSVDGGPNGVEVPGYEAGVDLFTMCGLPIEPTARVAVPVENAAGTDADLYIVDVATGNLIARLEDPALNPGLVIPGYEVGVDLVRWISGAIVAPVEGHLPAAPGLIVFHPDGTLASAIFDPDLLGFQRSVDPIVAPLTPPALVVPIGKDDGSDADVMVFPAPPNLGVSYSLEAENPGLSLSRFEWDVDPGLIDKTAPGELYLCVPEETQGGGPARLRFEITAGPPGDVVLALATETTAVPATLYFVDLATGNVLVELDDLWGLETGVDLAAGSGPVTPEPEPAPAFPRATGFDGDGDPTLAWVTAPAAVAEEPVTAAPPSRIQIHHANPFAAPGSIRLLTPARGELRVEIVDAAGRRVRRLTDGVHAAGEHALVWDGRDERGRRVAAGIYFLDVRNAEGAVGAGKLLLVR